MMFLHILFLYSCEILLLFLHHIIVSVLLLKYKNPRVDLILSFISSHHFCQYLSDINAQMQTSQDIMLFSLMLYNFVLFLDHRGKICCFPNLFFCVSNICVDSVIPCYVCNGKNVFLEGCISDCHISPKIYFLVSYSFTFILLLYFRKVSLFTIIIRIV